MYAIATVDLDYYNKSVLTIVLFVNYPVHSGGHGQTCQQSLPSQYNPSSDSSVTASNPLTFYLYPDFFNTAQCTGSIMNIQYEFCYMYTRNTGQRATVFTVLILNDVMACLLKQVLARLLC